MTESLGKKFRETSSRNGGGTAIKYKKENNWVYISYRELADKVGAFCGFLSQKGVVKSDKIAILLKNCPEWPELFFSIVSMGAIAIPINPEAKQNEIENILNNSESKLIFISEDFPYRREEILKNCRSLKEFILVESLTLKEARGSNLPDCAVSADETACILYTSGTTDEPKGVMLSHKNLLSNAESLYRLNLVTEKDSVVSILPLHHAYSLTVTMLLPILYGRTIVYPGTLRGEDLMRAMQESNPTIFVAVPQIFHVFHQKIQENLKKVPFPLNLLLKFAVNRLYKIRRATRINLSRFLFGGIHKKFGKSIRFFISGGAKLDEKVEEDLFKLGFTILEGYGLTETSPVLSLNPVRKPKIGSVGLPVPDVELDIVNKDEKNIGEVIARGPNIMRGYYKRRDLTDEVIRGGWFYTGDLGFFDDERYLFLTGRSKDVIVLSSGLNIYPEEIEEAYLKEVPAKEMCVFEVPSRKTEEKIDILWAVIVPDLEFFRKYGEVNLRGVIKERFDNVSKGLPPSKRIMGFTITLEPFPHTLLGKVKRFLVKEIYTPKILKEGASSGEKEIAENDRELMDTPIGKAIIDYLKAQTKTEKEIIPSDALEIDLGIDSLGRIELAAGLEQLFGVGIKDEVIGRSFTVRDLIMGCMESLAHGDAAGVDAGRKKEVSDSAYWRRLLEIPPKKESLAKIDLNPSFIDWLGGFIFVGMHWIFFKLFYNFKVEGRENFPEKRPCILYVNHSSYFDGFLVAISVPRFPRLELFFVGFRPYFTVPIIRNLVRIGRIIPLDFSSHLLGAMRSLYYVLKNGKKLCIFPEGMRTLDGKVAEFKKGFGILVKETNISLLPVVLEGAYEAWPRTSKFPKRHPIRVKYGKILEAGEAEKMGYSLGAKDSYEAICLGARHYLKKLKGEE